MTFVTGIINQKKMILLSLILLLLLIIINGQISNTSWNALKNIYNDGNGKNWNWINQTTAWNFDTVNLYAPCTTWQGIQCYNSKNITSIVLNSLNINGILSPYIGNLTSLTILNITNNKDLIGTIPSTINLLSSLLILSLNDNSLSGKVNLKSLSNLQFLSLNNNHLSGSFPSLSSSLSLVSISISNNSFTGKIPSLYSYHYLTSIFLDNNKFTGPLPSVFTSIKYINVANNSLSSYIPYPRPGYLIPNAAQLILSGNMLTGPLPIQLSIGAKGLTLLDVSDNLLSGTLDKGIWTLPLLNTFLLSQNRFTGSIVSYQQYTNSLVNVDFSFNTFSGSIPSFIFNSSNVAKVGLVSNCFQGSIPSTVCSSKSLKILALDGASSSPQCGSTSENFLSPLSVIYSSMFSKLEGSIPSCLFNLSNLEALHLIGNGLTGNIGSIGTSSSLRSLYLANNRLTGTIPKSMQTSASFIEIDLSNNKLFGGIETFIAGSNLTTLSLQVNRLSGDLPDLQTVENQNILDGNLFGCKKLKIDSGTSGLSVKSYFCSSELFLTSLTIWAIIFLSCISFYIWFCVSRQYPEQKYKGLIGKFFTLCSERFLHPYLASSISKFFSLGPDMLIRKQLIKDSLNGLLSAANLVEERAVLYAPYKYLEVQENTLRSSLFVLLSSFILFLPTYLWFKGKGPVYAQFSTYEYQYAFITTSAYLHGYKPSSTIIAFLTFVLVLAGVLVFRSKYRVLNKDRVISKQSSLKTLFKYSSSIGRENLIRTASWTRSSLNNVFNDDKKKKSRLNNDEQQLSLNRRRVIIFTRVCCEYLIQLTNTVLSFGINAFYVYMTTFSGKYYSTQTIYLIQVLLAVSKVLLSEVVVPFLCTFLQYAYSHLDNDRIQQHALVMNLVNFIVAPVLATMVVSKSCLYYTYHSYDATSVVSSLSVPSCYSQTVTANGVTVETCTTLDSGYSYKIVPNFFYSYQCGSTVLITYLSPLIFVYIINGIFYPLITFLIVILKDDTLDRFPFNWLPSLFATSYIKANYVTSKQTVFHGEEKDRKTAIVRDMSVARRLSDRTEDIDVMFSPSQTLQKYVAVPMTLMLTFGISSPLLGLTIFIAIMNHTFLSHFMIGKYLGMALKLSDSNDNSVTVQVNIAYAIHSLNKIIKEEDVRTLKSCWTIILFFIGLYWSFMFFDMIGDRWGIKHAATASSLLVTVYPIILFYLRKLLQPVYDLTYSKIEFNDPRGFEIKIDHNKMVISKVANKNNETALV